VLNLYRCAIFISQVCRHTFIQLGVMNTQYPWKVLTNCKLRSLPPAQQLESLAFAYLDSADALCKSLADPQNEATFEKGAVVLYLAAHAIELFLKGAIRRKAPKERFAHDIEHIHNRYRALFPEKRSVFQSGLFSTEYLGMTNQEIAEAKREQPVPSVLFRYPIDKTGEPWEAALGFEARSYLGELATLRADFCRILAAHDT
jgi:hypothetical protein